MLGLYNCKSDLQSNLSNVFDIVDLTDLGVEDTFPKIDNLFIDWLPQDHENFAHQAVIVENYLKTGKPTILFDRYFTLSYKEFSWLRKFQVTFLEPAIRNRTEFEYFPFWVDEIEIKRGPEKWDIDLGCKDDLKDDKIKYFEKYYKTYARLFPEKKTQLFTLPSVTKAKEKDWSKYISFGHFKWENCASTIILGTNADYQTGYLPDDLFKIMDAGCIPFMPIEHRFFGTAFKDLTVEDERDLDYKLNLYPKIRYAIVEELFDKILDTFPEMKINVSTERIKGWLS